MPLADRGAQLAARGKNRIGIDIGADFARDIGVGRRHQHQGNEGRLQRLVLQYRAERGHQAVVVARGCARAQRRDIGLEQASWPATAPPASD